MCLIFRFGITQFVYVFKEELSHIKVFKANEKWNIMNSQCNWYFDINRNCFEEIQVYTIV